MPDLEKLVFPDEGHPDRFKAALVGIIGGLAGAYALRCYWNTIAPTIFPPEANPANHDVNPAHSISLVGKQYQFNESAPAALGRVVYRQIAGKAPDDMARERLEAVMPILLGVFAGILYGGTRTTTRARDIAGGFFFGIRIWFNDTIGSALLGLRPGPGAYSREQHVWRMIGFWVYSFTTTAITRVVYRLV